MVICNKRNTRQKQHSIGEMSQVSMGNMHSGRGRKCRGSFNIAKISMDSIFFYFNFFSSFFLFASPVTCGNLNIPPPPLGLFTTNLAGKHI